MDNDGWEILEDPVGPSGDKRSGNDYHEEEEEQDNDIGEFLRVLLVVYFVYMCIALPLCLLISGRADMARDNMVFNMSYCGGLLIGYFIWGSVGMQHDHMLLLELF